MTSLQKWFLLQDDTWELWEINTFKSEDDHYFHIIDQIKVLRVTLWIGHCIFAWRVTWNHAYSLLNLKLFKWVISRAEIRDNFKRVCGRDVTVVQCLGFFKFWCGYGSALEKKWIRIRIQVMDISLRFTDFFNKAELSK